MKTKLISLELLIILLSVPLMHVFARTAER